VEGKHDVRSLTITGVSNLIITINIGLTLSEFCEKISRDYERVVILTDFDVKGVQLMDRLIELFRDYGVFTDTRLWNFLKRHYNIKSVEDLPWLIENQKEDHASKRK
jgi:Small primase-like proteins (Toprim domain)